MSDARFVITIPEVLPAVTAATKELDPPIPQNHIWIFDTLDQTIPQGYVSWRDFLTHGEADWVRFDNEHISRTRTAARLFSSGTTGLPKAVTLSHKNFVAQHTLMSEVVPPNFPVSSTIPFCPRPIMVLEPDIRSHICS